MVKYLLFLSTYHPAPVASLIDSKIQETIDNVSDAKTVDFWSWTPEQKSILREVITRMILTSHWSTGKTRIMFEKAKILAMSGETVLFVLFYSQISEAELDSFGKYIPIFLYCSLLNEIDLSKNENLKKNLQLVLTDNLQRDVISIVEKQGKDINVFIDEYAVNNKEDTKIIDQLSDLVDQSCYFWLTLGRVSYQENNSLQEWLEEKRKEYVIPNLYLSLRNSKEIIQYERSLEPEQKVEEGDKVVLEDIRKYVHSISSEDKETILKAMEAPSANTNEIPKCGLPDQNWPKSNNLTPSNQLSGFSIPEPVVSLSQKTLPEDIKNCFEKLNSSGRVMIIVLSKKIPEKLIQIIRKARFKKPIIVDENGELILMQPYFANCGRED